MLYISRAQDNNQLSGIWTLLRKSSLKVNLHYLRNYPPELSETFTVCFNNYEENDGMCFNGVCGLDHGADFADR